MKKNIFVSIICITVILFLSQTASAQVGPFANNTINATMATTVSPKSMELQIAPMFYWAKHNFDSDGNYKEINEGSVSSTLMLQVNSGITDKIEWGVMFPADASTLDFGLKYNFAQVGERWSFATAAWGSVPTASRNDLVNGDKNPDNAVSVGAGLVAQYAITSKINVYTDVFAQKYVSEVEPKHQANLYFDLDMDYEFSEGIIAVSCFSFQQNYFKETTNNAYLGTLGYGIIFAKWDNWNVLACHNFDAFGKNNDASNGIMFVVSLIF